MGQQLPTPMDPALFANLESDLILPEQYFPVPEPDWSGELSLLWTVFMDGIELFHKEVLRGNEASESFVETLAWIEEGDGESVFGFGSLCETFSLDPSWVRAALLDWRGRHHGNVAATATDRLKAA